MADPFHLEPLDDEEMAPPADAAGFELADLGELEQNAPAAPAEQTWADILLSGALGVGEGASFGHGAELGRLGAKIGDRLYDAINGDPARADRNDRSPGDDAAMYRRLGAIEPGNLNLSARPHVKNGDGTSTIRSMGFADGKDGPEILVPTVSDDGRLLTGDEAIALYDKTGKHLGKYPTVDASNAAAEALHLDQMARPPRNTLVDTSPVRVGRTAADQGAELSDRAMQTTAGKIGRAAGSVAASVPLSVAAGPGVLAQGAMGAAQGAAQAHGDDESMLGGAVAGGALGALGGAAAKGLRSVSGALRGPANPMLIGSGGTVADDAMAQLAKAKPQGLAAQVMKPWETAKAVAGQGAVRALTNADKAAPYAAGAGQLGAKAVGGWFGDETASPISWAAQSVLSSGNSGLSPQDEQRMTEAVLSGDKDKLAAADFASAMKSPDYGSRRQEQLQTLQRKDD